MSAYKRAFDILLAILGIVIATPVMVGALAGTSLSVGQATALITLPAIAGFALLTRGRQANTATATTAA